MKKILIILLLLTTLNTFSEEKTTDIEEKNDSEEKSTILGIQLENDGWFGSLFESDEFYTNGFSVDCTTLLSVEDPLSQFVDNLDRGIRYDEKFHNSDVDNIASRSIRIAQNMYTPEDIEVSSPIIDDRPYAGWTHFDFSVSNQYFKNEKNDHSFIGESQYGISIGSLGDAGAGATQTVVHHKSDDAPIPEGWDNHVKNRIALQLNFGRTKKLDFMSYSNPIRGFWFSTYWDRKLELGNVFLRGSQSITFKVGAKKEPNFFNFHDSSLLNLTRELKSDRDAKQEKLDNIKDLIESEKRIESEKDERILKILEEQKLVIKNEKEDLEEKIIKNKEELEDKQSAVNIFLTPKLYISAYNGTLDAKTSVDYNIEEVPVFIQLQGGLEITCKKETIYLSVAPLNLRSVEFFINNDPPENLEEFFYHSWGQVTFKCRY